MRRLKSRVRCPGSDSRSATSFWASCSPYSATSRCCSRSSPARNLSPVPRWPGARTGEGSVMMKYRTGMMLAIVLGFLASAGLATPCLAETASSSPRADSSSALVAGRAYLASAASSILDGVGHERGLHDRRLDQQVRWQGLESAKSRRSGRQLCRGRGGRRAERLAFGFPLPCVAARRFSRAWLILPE